jgi:putative ABC transport system ATP-binding protein
MKSARLVQPSSPRAQANVGREMSALEAIDVTKTYQEAGRAYDVLKGVNLSIQKGEVVALEGRSGSGKTTLLSILGCIMQPTRGRIVIDGSDVIVKTAMMVRRLSLGFVFQNCNLIPALRADQTVSYVLRLKGWAAKSAMMEAERLLDLVGLRERRNQLPRDLSGGEKQRLAIARAMAGDPAIILADEPTANLDSETAREILTLFRQLAKENGRALLIVTHDHAVRSIADRVLNWNEGTLCPANITG